MDDDLLAHAAALLQECRSRGLMIATAESCTGGLIAACLTEIAGSSDVVDRGFVTYSNEAKTDLLGVPPAMIARHGAVSEQVARQMAQGALLRSRAGLSIAVTGIAGPGGGSDEKPVGLVHLAVARADRGPLHMERRYGALSRQQIRQATVSDALSLLSHALSGETA